MSRYNIETLSFLIASFNDVISSFGKNSKSVNFYKRNVAALVAIGQVASCDARMIEQIVGMENTDAVKWESAEKKVSMFITGMNSVIDISDKKAIQTILEACRNTKSISEEIKRYIFEIYDIAPCASVVTKKQRFGQLNINNNTSESATNEQDDTITKIYKRLCNAKKDVSFNGYEPCIRVKNIEAVCSGDKSYYYITADCDIETLRTKYNKSISLLERGAEAKLGYSDIIPSSNPCIGPRRTFVEIDTFTL